LRNPGNRSIKSPFFAFFIAGLSLWFLWGCGVKGNPVPSGVVLPPAVKDLRVHRAPEGAELAWTMPAAGTEASRAMIYRSDLLIAEENCPGCPREYVLIAEPGSRDLIKEKGSKNAVYTDSRVREGVLYTYKIKLCDLSGYCGPESNQAEIKVRPHAPGAR
jgi:hypothetical protein